MSGPIVKTTAGKIQGSIEKSIIGEDYCAFKGVPYAKPPVDELRFRDPEPVESWDGIRDTTKFGPVCAQNNWILKKIDGSDDCLYLNVYVKSIESNLRQPVMVWFHGGGFMSGDGNDTIFSPDYLLRKDIVLVTINHRLGILGFLNLEDKIAPGNQGLKDQVMALKWVRNNIASFGGDPGNVTLFGVSAGGASVHYLTLSPLAKGLFHKAICQSGVALNPWASLTIDPKRFAYKMCSLLGKQTQNAEEIVDFLRTIDCKRLIQTQDQLQTKEELLQSIYPFGPGIDIKSDNPFMPVHPEIAAKEGIQVPLLIGYNSRESIISLKNLEDNVSEFDCEFEKYLSPNVLRILSTYNLTAHNLRRLYFRKEKISKENLEKLIDLKSDIKFVEGIHRTVKIQVEKSCAPTYLYQYTYDKTMSFFKTVLRAPMKGACHVDEVQHLFDAKLYDLIGFEHLKKGTAPYKIMEQMTELWTNFATIGIPTPYKTDLIPFYWQPLANDTVLRYLNICEDLRMETTLNLEQYFSSHTFSM